MGKIVRKKTVESQSVGYVISSITCKCGPEKSNPAIRGGTLYCKRCTLPFKYNPLNNEVYKTFELLSGSVSSDEGSRALKDKNNRLSLDLENAEARMREYDARIRELEQKIQNTTISRDQYSQRCSELERMVFDKDQSLRDTEEGFKAEVERLKGKLESSETCVESYKKQVESLECRVSDLEQYNRDLEDTEKHSRSELKKLESLGVPNVISSVMSYLASVNNKLIDGQDLESVRMFIDVRTEGLMMDLDNEGIKVTRHNRGDDLSDDRVDIIEKKTDDPNLDMRVVRSNSYGASFRNDIYPMIPESVTVYRCSSDAGKVHETGH